MDQLFTPVLMICLCGHAMAAAAEVPQDGQAKPATPSEEAQEVLAADPQTPAELVRAAALLAEMGQPEIAKGLLKKILDADLDPRGLIELAERFNVSMFVNMAGNQQLAPEAQQLADKIIAAVQQQRAAPQRIDRLIKQLGDHSTALSRRAMRKLWKIGPAAVVPVIGALADPSLSARHRAAVRTALAGWGSDAVQPLLAALEADDPAFVAEAISTLSQSGEKNATVFLLAPCMSPESPAAVRSAAAAALLKLNGTIPDRMQAADALAQRARDYYHNRVNLGTDENGMVTVWQWDTAERLPVATRQTAERAAAVLAERLAREALSVAPSDKNIRVLCLAAMLEKAALASGIDNPLPFGEGTAAEAAAEFGVDSLQAVVDAALPPGKSEIHPTAATAALQVLGDVGSSEELLYASSTPGVLTRAAHSSDARLRMAAVEAVVELKPKKPFAGASYVLDALKFAARSDGRRLAMLAGPSSERSRYIAGYLAALGYDLETATSGREMLVKLARSPDYELVFLDITTARPAADMLLQQLRHDWRLAALPVGVLAADGQLAAARRVVRNDPLAEAFARPHDHESMVWQIEQLQKLSGSRRLRLAIRQRQKAAALAMLEQIADREIGALKANHAGNTRKP